MGNLKEEKTNNGIQEQDTAGATYEQHIEESKGGIR